MNGCFFTKLLGCHCWSFMIHNRTHNKNLRGFSRYYSTFILICKWVFKDIYSNEIKKYLSHRFTSDVLYFQIFWIIDYHIQPKRRIRKINSSLEFLVLFSKYLITFFYIYIFIFLIYDFVY